MGCGGSKADDSPLVVLCRKRRELIRAAVNYRYALAAAHVSYFLSLKHVGVALRKFVEEELVNSALSSSVSSPSLILPATSNMESNKIDGLGLHYKEDEVESHMNLSDSSYDDDGEDSEYHNHKYSHDHNCSALDSDDNHQFNELRVRRQKENDFYDEVSLHDEVESASHYPRGVVNGFANEVINDPYAEPFSYSYPPRLFEEPYVDRWYQPGGYGNSVYGVSYGYSNWGLPATTGNIYGVKASKDKAVPPPPSPKASGWGFFNPFDVLSDNGYLSYYSSGRYEHGSNTSSPDSNELREREGIPDLEEDTENEAPKDSRNGKRMEAEEEKRSRASIRHSSAVLMRKDSNTNSGRTRKSVGSSRLVPLNKSDNCSKSVTSWSSDESEKLSMPSRHSRENEKQHLKEVLKPSSPPFHKGTSWAGKSQSIGISLSDEKNIPETYVSNILDERSTKKKGVSFELEDASLQNADSSKLTGGTPLSPRGDRDLWEVVAEIRDDFEIASGFGKEVAMMLEVGKLPHQLSFLKEILPQVICHTPSMSSRDASSIQSLKLASATTKLAKSYIQDVGKDVNTKPCSLSSTLDKLLVWEKKLYKEVKDEEQIRVKYEKQCKKLKLLDEGGAEATKLDATQASIRRLRTKLDITIKTIDGISRSIHELRDEELQPQVASLIHGLIRMWKAMLKFHQKQFQAIMESKMRKLKANAAAGLQTDLNSKASIVLEKELGLWLGHFSNWIGFQKSYVESLNGWLLHCLQYEPEETPDGIVPYSPGQLGAPPIFVTCNDWHQAMGAISEARVASAMNTFATILRQLGEKQDEEGRLRLKVEYLSKDHEKHLRTRSFDGEKLEREQDAMSDKTGLSLVPSDNGVSPLNDLKVDLDFRRHRLTEDRIKYKNAVKLVHDTASSSLQSGLVPIFKAFESFSSEALKLHEHVRLMGKDSDC